MKATCYHIRNAKGEKVVGGTIGSARGDLNDAADQLTRELDIIVMPGGRLSYARNGAPVDVYLSVDPGETEKGGAVLRAHHEARAQAEKLRAEQEEAEQQALEDAIEALGGRGKAIDILKKASAKS